MSMQLHASRREGPSKLLVEQNEVEVSYALEARPLSTEENGSASRIVRVRVDLFSPEGNPVTPNAVVLDLLTNPDGSHHITRVRVEPAKSHRENHDHGDRPWRMKFWQTQMGALFKHPQDKQASSSNGESQHNTNPSEAQAVPDSEPDSAAVSQPGFVFSPYWSPTYSRPSHRHARNRDPSRTFMRLVRPVILPALLGAAAGLVACLVGFVVGHLVMSISVRLGLAKKCKQHRRSRVISVEDGSPDEKAQLVPET